MKKKLTILLMTMCIAFGSITVHAATSSGCPYKSTHVAHEMYTQHPSNMEYKLYIYPDYTMGQMHLIEYYKCKSCTYCCCAREEYFGSLISSMFFGEDIEEK